MLRWTLLSAALGVTLTLLGARPAGAISVTLSPSDTIVGEGQSFDVAIDISGLGAGVAPSLGIFDLDITFDPAILGFVSATYGDPVLGDQLGIVFPSQTTTTAMSGTVNLFALSIDSPAVLNGGQAESFTLAVLTFLAASAGTSPLDLAVRSLGDANGDPLQASASGASVTVVPEPEPSALLVVLLGGLLMARALRGASPDRA